MSLSTNEFFEVFGDELEKCKLNSNPTILLKDQYFAEDENHEIFLTLLLEIDRGLFEIKVSGLGCFFAEDEPEDLLVERVVYMLGLTKEDAVARLDKFWEGGSGA